MLIVSLCSWGEKHTKKICFSHSIMSWHHSTLMMTILNIHTSVKYLSCQAIRGCFSREQVKITLSETGIFSKVQDLQVPHEVLICLPIRMHVYSPNWENMELWEANFLRNRGMNRYNHLQISTTSHVYDNLGNCKTFNDRTKRVKTLVIKKNLKPLLRY